MGELCLVPDSFLCLVFDLFKEDGKDSDLEREGVGVFLADPGALDTCGLTGATWDCLLELGPDVNGLMDLEVPFPVLTRDTGPEELGVNRSIALLDSVGVILLVGV